VIIDFIGNYANNYMIPIALSGDRSYNKDHMRRFVDGGSRLIPGTSTIYIDEISRKRIFESIDTARTNDTAMLREAYAKLKDRLGRIPEPDDFEKYGTVDISKYFDKFGSYYNFLVKYEKDYHGNLTKTEQQLITFISQKLTKGKRPEELMIIRDILDGSETDFRLSVYKDKIYSRLGHRESTEALLSAVRNLTNRFAKDSERSKYSDCVFMESDGNGGYFYDKVTKQLPVFINYEKSDDAIAYEDRFISPENLIALSKHPRKIDSSDADHFYKRTPEDKDNRIYLFIRKNKDDNEAKEFYFLGEIEAEGEPAPVKMSFNVTDKDGNVTGTKQDDAFEISYHLDVPVREDIYDYIVS